MQGTPQFVKEPDGHVQCEPNSVINLVSEEKGGWTPESVEEYIERTVEEQME